MSNAVRSRGNRTDATVGAAPGASIVRAAGWGDATTSVQESDDHDDGDQP